MTKEDFSSLKLEADRHSLSAIGALISIGERVITTILGFWLSGSSLTSVWLLGQVILGLSFFHWFSIIHDCGHNAFWPKRFLNECTGAIASLICGIPYFSWKYTHLAHHQWTGYLDRDPSMSDLLKPNSFKSKMAKLAWKSWLPFFALSFLFGTFWNLPKLFRIFPQKTFRFEIAGNLLLILIFQIGLSRFFPTWTGHFVLAYLIFGFVCEPIILSQHVHLPMQVGGPRAKPLPPWAQDEYTRGLLFPDWISRFVTLSFENHIVHHYFPNIPSYNLWKFKIKSYYQEPGFIWIWRARKIPGDVLLFSDRSKTGIEI